LEGTGEYDDQQLYPLPGLVFLDLKLPFLHAFVVLAWIKKQDNLNGVHVIILRRSGETPAALYVLFLFTGR
jgi:DNA-binding response OmpR family regulator